MRPPHAGLPAWLTLLLISILSASAAAADLDVAAIEITGVTRFDPEMVWETIGVKPGGRLRRDLGDVARLLEEHYHTLGYAAATVRASFDEATGTLRVAVDEGRVAAIELEGVRPAERARVEALLDLRTGAPFNDEEVASALRRLEGATAGAFEGEGEPPYSMRRDADGVHVTLRLRRRGSRIWLRPGGTGRAALLNRVDGLAPGLTTNALLFAPSALNPIELYAHTNYAFAAERLRWAVGALRRFGSGGALVLGYEHHDFTDTDDTFRAVSGVERYRGWYLFFSTFQDYYRRRGHEAWVTVRPSPRLHVGVSFRSDVYASQPIVSDGNLLGADPPPNPAVSEGLSRSMLLTARWAWKDALFDDWREEREAFLVRDPYGTSFRRAQALRIEGTFEAADADALGGVFTFRRFTGHARGAARLSLRHWLLARLSVGLGSDGLPPQRRFALGGLGTLRGRELNDVEGDRMALATAEWSVEPNSPWPALILFYDGGTAWDRGRPAPGWRSDVGAGLAWPPGDTRFVRVDAALPLNRVTGERRLRLSGHLLIPF